MTKKLLLALVLLVVAFVQCGTHPQNQLLSAGQLPSQYFTIDISRDTVLHTEKGALIKIPKGSLQADGGATVKLEIKEAYTITDMILGGLTTKAGKALLSSGGMIYINPADKNVKILQPISVSIPTRYRQDGMELYTGVQKPDGGIDWTDPQPVPKPELPDTLAKGKALFMANCASCHHPVKDATGPALAFLDKRREWKWLVHHIHNSSEMVAQGDPLSVCIFNRFNKTQMTAFPQLTEEEIHRIFDYVDNQAGGKDPSTLFDFKKSFDSCQVYMNLMLQLATSRDSLIIDNGKQVVIERINPDATRGRIGAGSENGPGFKPENMVVPANNYAEYYQFNIKVFGWYNVDVLFRDMPGFANSMLIVPVIGEFKDNLNIYLVIPSYKVFVPGGPVAGKTDEYAFFTDDGLTPLPLNVKAYIIAMGDYKGQVWYGHTEFTTSLKQSPQVQLAAMTREQMNEEVKKLDISEISIMAKDSKNAAQIRKIDAKMSELEKLKPKGCDCNCLGLTDSISVK